jgi:hypothetical protein
MLQVFCCPLVGEQLWVNAERSVYATDSQKQYEKRRAANTGYAIVSFEDVQNDSGK